MEQLVICRQVGKHLKVLSCSHGATPKWEMLRKRDNRDRGWRVAVELFDEEADAERIAGQLRKGYATTGDIDVRKYSTAMKLLRAQAEQELSENKK
jgi:hypothetical protein